MDHQHIAVLYFLVIWVLIDIDIQTSISERSSGWAINYRTTKRHHFCVDPVARRASGRPPGPDFGPKICIFLRYAYITPIFLGRTDPTQWDHKSPIS